MDAAVVQVSKPVRNSRHYDSAPVQPEDIDFSNIRKLVDYKINEFLKFL